ncbi:nitrate/nitrite transporter [Lonsdalea britannica]|uniref:MFS transporter n=1 Tax=Lonsdalea britannica TaxID=1082704 RepID=UPI0026F17187|nr:MFS transporter [Lonsdalea britannica]
MPSERMTTRRPASLVSTASVAIILTLYIAIVFGFGLYLFSVLVTFMQKSLGFGIPAVGIITGGAQVSYLTASLLCSSLTRRFGGGNVIFAAALTAGFLLTLLSAVQNIWQAGALLIALGSCAAMAIIPTVGVIGKVVPVAWQSSINGLISSGTAYGQFATGLLVPFLIHDYDWRTVWMVIGVMSIAVAIIGYTVLRGVAADVFRVKSPQHCLEKQANPDKRPRLMSLATPRHFLIWTLLALSGIACGPWQNYLASFLGNEQHFSISFIGQLWSMIGVTGLISGFAFGLLADKIGVRITLALSYGLLVAAGLLVAIEGGTIALRVAAIAFGLSFYAIFGLIPAYITKAASPEASTAIFAVANVFLGIGTSFGNAGSGFFQSWMGSFQGIYAGVAAIAAVAMILTLLLPDERKITKAK